MHHGDLVIRTRRPIDRLASRLALPYFCVLPAGIPTPPGGYQDPLPTAGPYYLYTHHQGDLAVLRPNPGYRGPRPQNLDGIIFDLNVDDRTGVTEVHRGHLDYFAGSHVAAGKRLGCRTNPAHLPALDLATLCVAPPNA